MGRLTTVSIVLEMVTRLLLTCCKLYRNLPIVENAHLFEKLARFGVERLETRAPVDLVRLAQRELESMI